MSINPSSKCHFLSVPKEIRLHIYRELLMPGSAYLSILPEDDNADDAWLDDDDEPEDISETGSHSARDSDSDDEIEGIGRAQARSLDREGAEFLKRDPTILRVNRKIYEEASSLMYTEGILMLFPGDIFCLSKYPKTLKFGAPSEPNPWRHDPLLGFQTENGVAKYTSGVLEGRMDPHVFARFQRVYFYANFDFEHTQNVELWIDDKTQVVDVDDAKKFQKLLHNSTIMKDFVKIVGKSSRINSLEVELEVEVMANSELMMADMLEEDDPTEEETEATIDRFMEMSNEKATEMFVDSGICEPLLKLKNVKNLNFHFGFDHRDEDKKYKPLRRHLDLIGEWKKKVEKGFKEVAV